MNVLILLTLASAVPWCVLASPLNHRRAGQFDSRASCIHNNQTYIAGQKFKPDPCTSCHCRDDGRTLCSIMDCLFETNCIEYAKEPNVCCQRCVRRGCQHADGRIYLPGQEVRVTACEYCFCPPTGGRVECVKASCPRLVCVDAVQKDGACCPRCPHGRSLSMHYIHAVKYVEADLL